MNTEITYEKFFKSMFWKEATREDIVNAIKCGADIYACNGLNRTPMHFAAGYSSSGEVIDFFLEREIDVSACDFMNATPLHYAAAHSETPEVVKKLLDKVKGTYKEMYRTADFPTKSGLTPLHCAVKSSKSLEVIRLFLDYEADSNAADKHGNTPMHYAARSFRASEEVIELLIVKEANPNNMNCYKKTPEDYIKRNSNLTPKKKQHILKTLEDYDQILDKYYCDELGHIPSNGHFLPKK